MIAWLRRGALGGVIFFAVLLAFHVVRQGRIEARYGPTIGPEQRALNLWASLVEATFPNPWVHSQRFGDPPPRGDPEPPTDRWSAPAWLAAGMLGYALTGMMVGVVIALGADRKRR
ncbi:MAG: hypothetical protein IAG13_06140 [Deltaproteobacteria bacterium]|nr:hypothetical protein [Nannocystaceae bacterium]